jgi:hypothetical protein
MENPIGSGKKDKKKRSENETEKNELKKRK